MVERRVKLIEWLNSVEQENEVDSLKIDDLHLWPLLRWSLAKDFLDQEKLLSDTIGDYSSNFSIFHNLKMYIVGFWCYLKLKFKLVKKATVLFSGGSNHYGKFDGDNINKLFYPLIEVLTKSDIASLTADYSTRGKATNSNSNDFPLLWTFNFYNKLIYPFKKKPIEEPLYLDTIFLAYQKEFGYNFDRKKFYKRIADTFKWAYIFELLIAAFDTNWHFGIAYYTPQMYGMNLACYRKNVKSIDLQHGPQGVLHPAYSGFQKIPSLGYSTFPKIFWCWDDNSTNHLKSIFKNNNIHKSFNGGHPWIYYLEKHNKIKPVQSEDNILVFSLQPFREPLPPIVLEAIANTPPGYIWWLRFHPRMAKQDVSKLKVKLDKYIKTGLVSFDLATALPLPSVLKSACLHLTQSSGCFLEASALGIPNLIVEETGYLYFKNMVDNKANYCQTTGDLWEIIDRIIGKKQVKSDLENVEKKLLEMIEIA